MTRSFFTLLCFLAISASSVAQTELTVTVENLQPAGGLFFTPVWVGFHDGAFDAFDVGGTASAALEAIAEGGETEPLSASFVGMGVDAAVAPGSPFGPSGSSFPNMASMSFSVDPMTERYFSYASMIIPSNDGFFGNDSPTAHALFDGSGTFTGPLVIDIVGADIYDASTEVNDINGGAAFSVLGGTSVDEAMPIGMHAGLDDFIGTGTANGETILSAFAADTPIARITVRQVPEPSCMFSLLAAVPGIGMLRRRRRQS